MSKVVATPFKPEKPSVSDDPFDGITKKSDSNGYEEMSREEKIIYRQKLARNEKAISKNNETVEIDVGLIDPLSSFPHAFEKRINRNLDELVESISANGILQDLILRPKDNGRHEILAGHRRHKAAVRVGLKTVPAKLKECNDDEAIIIVNTTNLNVPGLLISEKASAYKQVLDAMNRQGEREDLLKDQIRGPDAPEGGITAQNGPETTSSTKEAKLRSDEFLAKQEGVSRNQIQKLVRLNELIAPLLNMVDEGDISVTAGYELSFVNEDVQVDVHAVLEDNPNIKISISQAETIKNSSENGPLDITQLEIILGIRRKEKETAEPQPAAKLPKQAYEIAFKSVTKLLNKEAYYLTKQDKADPKEIERRVRRTIEAYYDEL